MEESFNKLDLDQIKTTKHRLQTCSLQHEFSLLNMNIPHIDVELLDPNKRNAMVRVSVNGHVIMMVNIISIYNEIKEFNCNFFFCSKLCFR